VFTKRKPESDSRKPVSKVVHEILDQVRIVRTDGPSSGLYSRDAQLSGALTQAGTLLAKLDKSAPGRKSSVFHSLLGVLSAPPQPRRRSWFFASNSNPASPLDAKRIEKMLQVAALGGRPLVLDQQLGEEASSPNGDIDCHLPAGAVDPVCEPR